MRKIPCTLALIAFFLVFLSSCASFKQALKDTEISAPPKETKSPPRKVQRKIDSSQQSSKENTVEPKKIPESTEETPPAPTTAEPQSPQQKYYDLGMKYYSEEKYAEAKKAWQMVVRLNKKTLLAKKARDNIKKTDRILKTLEGIHKR